MTFAQMALYFGLGFLTGVWVVGLLLWGREA